LLAAIDGSLHTTTLSIYDSSGRSNHRAHFASLALDVLVDPDADRDAQSELAAISGTTPSAVEGVCADILV